MKKTMCVASVCLAAVAGVGIIQASGPIAVYAVVDKVTFEPSADKPERIIISGVFSAVGAARNPDGSWVVPSNANEYSKPQGGYLYFSLPDSNAELALREWADLKTVAGTRQVVGFGSSWYAGKLRVRKADERPESPDPYRMGNGVIRINADNPHAKELLEHQER
jgi:hypothetical protein